MTESAREHAVEVEVDGLELPLQEQLVIIRKVGGLQLLHRNLTLLQERMSTHEETNGVQVVHRVGRDGVVVLLLPRHVPREGTDGLRVLVQRTEHEARMLPLPTASLRGGEQESANLLVPRAELL